MYEPWLTKFCVAFMQRLVGVVRFPCLLLDNGSLKSLEIWWRCLEQEKTVSRNWTVDQSVTRLNLTLFPERLICFQKFLFLSAFTVWNWIEFSHLSKLKICEKWWEWFSFFQCRTHLLCLQGGRVTLVLGLPWHSHISSFFAWRVYKAGREYPSKRVTLPAL